VHPHACLGIAPATLRAFMREHELALELIAPLSVEIL
jgi:hypothetical protein